MVRTADPTKTWLQIDLGGAALDFFEGDEVAAVDARAGGTDAVPCFGTFEVRIPEWPGAALPRSHGIDGAPSGGGIEERAIAVGVIFQSPRAEGQPGVIEHDRSVTGLAILRDRVEFRFVHPHEPRLSRTAVAALSALKSQARVIPRRLFSGFRHPAVFLLMSLIELP